MPQTRVLGDSEATSMVGDEETKGLPQRPSTPYISGGFDSPAVESPEARGDQSRGATHIHNVDARVRDIPAMGSPEVRCDHSHGSAQDRGVGAGLMLSPQWESSGQQADLSALGGGALGMHALAQTVIAGKTVYLQGAKISPAQVAKFVDNKKMQLRSGVFLLAQLDTDID